MINNVSFNGHARINLEIPPKNQLKLYEAITEKKNKEEIKALPDDVEIKFSSERFTHEDDAFGEESLNYYVAEFFKKGDKIGKTESNSDPNQNEITIFIGMAINECKRKLGKHKEPSILDKLKSNDGLVV